MVGETVGHFRIVRRIGEGGMGHVYLADDLRLDRQVALKVLAHGSPSPEQIARFEREAKATAGLNHPNILSIHDYGVHASMPYVVMELLEGRNLRQVLREGPLSTETALDYASALIGGLSAAHEKGIGHRDLKPENIFVTRDGRVKILDFGLATTLGGGPTSPADQVTGVALTLPGVVMGTAGYMAPEQVMGERVDARADIFAFGAVLFEMLTGRRAFDGSSAIDGAARHPQVGAAIPALESVVSAGGVRVPSSRSCADVCRNVATIGFNRPPSWPRHSRARASSLRRRPHRLPRQRRARHL